MDIFLQPKLYMLFLQSPVIKELAQLEVQHPDLHEPPLQQCVQGFSYNQSYSINHFLTSLLLKRQSKVIYMWGGIESSLSIFGMACRSALVPDG